MTATQTGRPDWMDRARCAGTDPDLFHPVDPDQPSIEATRLCVNCPVLADCTEHALTHEVGERSVGYWAAMTPRQRRATARRRARLARDATPDTRAS